jgi:ParB family chromosome partitioning protein
MSRKRRIFDIDLPEAGPETGEQDLPRGAETGRDGPPGRRGPMAAAIAETGDALRDRAAIEAAIRAENDALAHEHVRLKRAGLIVDLVPLGAVEVAKLVRDRRKGEDPELEELIASIRDVGLSNPIRVEPRPDGRYELIQGWRRLAAYRALLAETGDTERWGRIPAGIVARGEALETLYRRMVDENLVRKDISFAEMAQLAIDYAGTEGTAHGDPDRAVALLFRSAGYQKRSYIRAFIRVLTALGESLRFAHEIPRALGLRLAQRLEERPEIADAIRAALAGREGRTAQEELEVLARFAGAEGGAGPRDAAPDPAAVAQPPAPRGRGAGGRRSFTVAQPGGEARCTAAAGRLEIRLDRDFAALDTDRLTAAVRALLDRLG